VKKTVLFSIFLIFNLSGCNEYFEPQKSIGTDADENTPKPINSGGQENDDRDQIHQPEPQILPAAHSTNDDEPIEPWDFDGEKSVISEGNRASEFTDWLEEQKPSRALEQIITKTAQDEFTLQRNVVLSFSSFSTKSKIKILTKGHQITLIGNDFGDLLVDSTSPEGNAGDVLIFASGKSLPTVIAKGKNGVRGEDAVCTSALTPCVPLDDAQTRLQAPQDNIEWEAESVDENFQWDNSRLTDPMRRDIRSSALPAGPLSSGYCDGGESIHLRIDGEFWSGYVTLRQHLVHPKANAAGVQQSPRDAVLFEAQPGKNGFSGGNVRILRYSKFENEIQVYTSEGDGGYGGLRMKSPASAKSSEHTLSSQKRGEELITSGISAHYRMVGNCASEFGRPPHYINEIIPIRFSADKIATTTQELLIRRELIIPAQSEGKDDLLSLNPRAPSGVRGRPGKVDVKKVKDWMTWRAYIPKYYPVPADSRTQSTEPEMLGRFSLETFGLKTLPLKY